MINTLNSSKISFFLFIEEFAQLVSDASLIIRKSLPYCLLDSEEYDYNSLGPEVWFLYTYLSQDRFLSSTDLS